MIINKLAVNLFNSFRGTNMDSSSNEVHMKIEFDNSVLRPIADIKSKPSVEKKKVQRPHPKFAEDESTKY